MFTARVFWRRDRVLKSGTVQSMPISCSRLSTKPVVCRNALPGSGQAGLHSSIAVGLLTAPPARRRGLPACLGIEPYRQRATALERFIVGRPVLGLVGWGCGAAHSIQLPRWIQEMNPSRDLCTRALPTTEAANTAKLAVQVQFKKPEVGYSVLLADRHDHPKCPVLRFAK